MWADPIRAKAFIGNLADGVKLFDRLTGEQLVLACGVVLGAIATAVGIRLGGALLDRLRAVAAGEPAPHPHA